jgi:uncharacterized integral membrane protein
MWLKIKVWTKVVIFGIGALYALIFLVNNAGQEVHFWYWFGREPKLPALVVVVAAFVTGIIGTILIGTTFKTINQIRELQSRGRAVRLTREVEEMKAKAATLRTREADVPPADPTL